MWKDYKKAIEAFHAAIALDAKAENFFSMGIALGLNKNDSAPYYMERSIELAVQAGDTSKIVHYLRNYAQMQAYLFDEPSGAIATIRRMEQYVIDPVQLRMGDLVKVEVFLKEGLLDSAEYYLNKERKRGEGRNRFLTEENMVAVYRALIDYTRHRTFDVLDVARYNDSVANALAALQSTVRRKDESKETLSQANLILTVERKQAQLNLLLALLVLVLAGGGVFLYVRNRRNRLIEAEERAETLTRLLEDATKNQSKEESDGTEIPGTNFDYNYLQHRKVDVVSSALDFILPFEKYKITAGAKVSFTNTRNGINYDTSDPTLVQDDYFRYKEQIYALYADYSREYSERFSMQLGLRMEHTRTTGISEAKDTEDKHDYTRLFPTVYLLYSPTDGHALNFSFSNRISRPSQNMVNPFPFYQNKYTYACGREDLKPSYTYNVELGYTLKNNFNVSAYYSYSDDVFFQVVDLDAETNVTSFLWENFMQTHAFGLNNSYTFRTKWLQAYAQHGVSYRRTTSSAATTSPEEKGWAYDASLRNTFFFNEKKTLLATLSGSYSSRQYQGIYLMSPTYSVSAGMLYRLLNNKLSLSLNVNNLFVSHSKLETMSNGLKIIADNQFAFTGFRIGVSYTFGGDIRSKGQRNSNEDIQRRL
ncbi:MAG: outer membrane beta-barrel family protein [Bacteroides sp.]|uniref:outer membrane beta-barrel family protein n=1 Tax=Bacteroides sp. TaxID=29523 RepID=UPI0026DEB445|nr:outer membrane beta-barrel family protein [Bacteroides sp.]MDO5420337.1 outer membrane beta-barrel family protein [Bacteroides sp.]